MNIIGTCILVGAFLSLSTIEASVGNASHPDAPLQLLRNWILQTGKPSVVRGNIMRAAGLADRDVFVLERGFRGEGEQSTHVCATAEKSDHNDNLIFVLIDEYNGSGTVWLTSVTGELIRTVRFGDGETRVVATRESVAQFSVEKNYFIRKTQNLADISPDAKSRKPAPSSSADAPPPFPAKTKPVLRSEKALIARFPWVVPVIVGVLACGARIRRRD